VKVSQWTLGLLVVVMLGSCLFAQETVDNPVYQQWAKFKVGTMAKYHQSTEVMGNKTETELAYTLVEVTPEKVVVEMSGMSKVMGNNIEMPKTKIEYQAKVAKGQEVVPNAPPPNTDSKQSEEQLTIAGMNLKCHVIQTTLTQEGMESVSQIWSCDEIPGTLVKSETKMEKPVQSLTTISLVEVVKP
jgi:hypothetical protein